MSKLEVGILKSKKPNSGQSRPNRFFKKGIILNNFMSFQKIPELKPLYLERITSILNNEEDLKKYLEILKIQPVKSIRGNTLRISVEKLKEVLENKGTIIANEVSMGRLMVLASNLERCGVTNTIISRKDGVALCKKFVNGNIQFDKILVDAPCSGEGTLRSSRQTYLMWNIKTIQQLSKLQKQLFKSAFEILKINGEMIYSTCTHAPEENEEIVNWALEEFKDQIKIEKINLPVKSRQGLTKWQNKEYFEEVKYSCRIYPQDNNTEGFFLAKFKKIK